MFFYYLGSLRQEMVFFLWGGQPTSLFFSEELIPVFCDEIIEGVTNKRGNDQQSQGGLQ